MRKLLLAAAATAPLALAAVPAAAQTVTTISTATTTPVATATANNGAPSDIDLSSAGSINTGNTSPAITLNSNNNVTVEGTITSDNVDNATGILLQGGNSGFLTVTGTITVGEDYAATDTLNSDGIAEAPFAQGTGRYGVRLVGPGTLQGSVVIDGALTVKGNNSYGVSLEAPVAGILTVGGTTTVTGDNSIGVIETGGVAGGGGGMAAGDGAVNIAGSLSVTGQGAQGVRIDGDLGDSLRITGAVSATGYATTARQADAEQAKIQATPTDVEESGGAVIVDANVAGGIYLSAPPTNTVTGTLADVDGDGVPDGEEATGSIINYGSAPALLIGATGGKAITVGEFGTGDNAYGLLVRGTISGIGILDNVPATGLQIGTGDGAVTLAGGARVVGEVSASTYEADATAVHVMAGATVPTFRIDGTISAASADSTLITTPAAATATAILAEAGSQLGSLVNTGTISASAVGDQTQARAVVDGSGTLSNVLNEGAITAVIGLNKAGDATTHRAVALDLSSNASGVTLVQQLNPNPNTVYGSTDGTTDTATTDNTAVTPSIVGDVLLGNGPNTVQILAGSLIGALSLGSNGGSSLTIDGGASVIGPVTYTGNALALNIANGTLNDGSASRLGLSSLNIGSTGSLIVAVSGASATYLQSSGPATIATGATFGVNLLALPAATTNTYTIISAPTLAAAEATQTGNASYLYTATFDTNPAAGTVTLELDRKSQAELGLTNSEYNSLTPVLTGTGANPNLLQAALAQTDRGSFIAAYDQLLPDHAGGIFLAAQEAAESIGHAALDAREMDFAPGAWVQEFALGVEQNRNEAVASHTGGFGVAAGFETGASALGQFGVTTAFANATAKNPDIDTDSQASFSELEGGVYWRAAFDRLQLGARVGGGYLFGFDRRYLSIAATDVSTAVSASNKGTWHGYTVDARASAGYQVPLGKRWFVRPQLVGEYFRLNQDGYQEYGGGPGIDLAVNSRTGDSTTGTASVVFGGKWGRGIVWRPTLEVGARDVFQGNAGDTTAHFLSGGDDFTLVPNSITGVGGIARIGLKAGASSYEVYIDAQGQEFSKYREGDVRTGVRVLF